MTLAPALRAALWALGLGMFGTLAARATAWRLGWISRPNPIVPQHTRPVAYLGGLGIAFAVALALAISGPPAPAAELRLGIPASLFLLLGLIDDARALSAAPKFALQALAATIAVASGVAGTMTGHRLLDGAISVFWMLTLVNAFNFLDVCDGLLAGVSAVFFAYAAIAVPDRAVLAACIAGATLGFLAFNRPRASIFLGDAGSHLLGFLAAALTLGAGRAGAAAPVALGIPLFEALFITIVRIGRGVPWWKGSRDHIALRLQSMGWSAWGTDLFAWSWAAALAALALALPAMSRPWAVTAVLGLFLGALAAAGWLLGRTEPRLGSRG